MAGRAGLAVALALAIIVAGCGGPRAPGAAPDGSERASEVARPTPVKRITAAIMGDPPGMSTQKTHPVVGSVPGLDALEQLVHAGLVYFDYQGNARPQLAETVPTLDNGLWKVFPDGRMETTWTIRQDARWHDGAPVTTDDLLFTMRVEQDREVEIPRNPAYGLIESVHPADQRTMTVRWAQPYIEADAMFSYSLALPWPAHLLERTYVEDKASLLQMPYWTIEFVGAGPFKVKEWVLGSHVMLAANERYPLGRPKIDEIEVKFIPDPSTLISNILAGGVDYFLGRGLGLEQGLQIRDQWREGRLDTYSTSWLPIYPQFVNPQPPIVTNPQFRRALLHAIDRQGMVDSLMAGLSAVSHSFLSPDQPEYAHVQGRIARYEYDPRRATQIIEGLGYAKGTDGVFRDAAGQRLSFELRTTAQLDIQPKSTFAVADYWQRIGLAVDQLVVPFQRIPDREYRANFPAFELVVGGNSTTSRDIRRFHSSSAPLAENRYAAFGNYARYQNPEFDALIDRYLRTIPKQERTEALGQIVQHQSEQLTLLGVFYVPAPSAISHRLENAGPRGRYSTEASNAHEWNVKG